MLTRCSTEVWRFELNSVRLYVPCVVVANYYQRRFILCPTRHSRIASRWTLKIETWLSSWQLENKHPLLNRLLSSTNRTGQMVSSARSGLHLMLCRYDAYSTTHNKHINIRYDLECTRNMHQQCLSYLAPHHFTSYDSCLMLAHKCQ